MHWKEAIENSKKGTATKSKLVDGITTDFIRYKNGTGFKLVSNNGKVDYFLSRPATDFELLTDQHGFSPS